MPLAKLTSENKIKVFYNKFLRGIKWARLLVYWSLRDFKCARLFFNMILVNTFREFRDIFTAQQFLRLRYFMWS